MLTVADEKMATLLLENNVLYLKMIKNERRKLSRNEKKSKHVNIDKEGDSGESF